MMLFPELARTIKDAYKRYDPYAHTGLTQLSLGGAKQYFTPASASYPIGSSSFSLLPRTSVDYSKEVGDGLGSSVLMSPIKWIQRTFPEAPLEVARTVGSDVEAVENHKMVSLIRRPNPYYSGSALWAGTLFSWIVSGDGYWVKRRGKVGDKPMRWWENISGPVTELWYFPHWLMTPKYPEDGSVFISHYEYSVRGQRIEIPLDNVIHFRNGIDPRDTRHGLSLIYSELREIFTDDEAASFIASLLTNMAVPGLVISPDFSAGMPSTIGIGSGDLEAMKEYVNQSFRQDNRGKALVIASPTKLQQFGFNPAQLQLGATRDIAEERICAALGIPAAVVGFGAGLQQTKVGATMHELIELAWKQCLIPMQKAMAEQLEMSLLPDFEPRPQTFAVRFNHHEVSALQENKKDTAEAMNIGIAGGWVKVSEGRRALGLDVNPEDEIYLRGIAVIETTGEIIEREPIVPDDDDDEEDPKARRTQRKASDLERRIISDGVSGRPTNAQKQLIAKLNREAIALGEQFEADLGRFFAKMGSAIADAAMDVLEPSRSKATEGDELAARLTATSILRRVEIETLRKNLGEIGGAHYLRVAKSTLKALVEVIGLAVDLPDARGRELVAIGGRRLGLVDLTEQTRRRLFRELSAGRELGEGPVELARRIRQNVPAGKWGSSATRASVISRTETLHAQRVSTLEAYRDAENVTAVMVFDGRIPGSDEECIALDGKIVSIEEAWELMADEHPNGTRNFAPVVGERE